MLKRCTCSPHMETKIHVEREKKSYYGLSTKIIAKQIGPYAHKVKPGLDVRPISQHDYCIYSYFFKISVFKCKVQNEYKIPINLLKLLVISNGKEDLQRPGCWFQSLHLARLYRFKGCTGDYA